MKLTKAHYHEIADRTSVICENIETHIVAAYTGGDKVVKQKAVEAQKILWDLYQHAGARM
jgi:hypothetical protein